jgi:hypothetical protein
MAKVPAPVGRFAMKTPLIIVLVAVVLVVVSTLAVMNSPARAANMGGALRHPAYGTT